MLKGLAPVWRVDARVLVLGSFPGAVSLAAQRYYAHPRNAFWPLMEALLAEPGLAQRLYERRLQALQACGIALWDAVAACEREGSLDSAIRRAQPSGLAELVAPPAHDRLQRRHRPPRNHAPAARRPWPLHRLPSTSPAHAALDQAAKREAWRQALRPVLG